jgi:pyruvate-ferredoxin/flavodoxin oxidoreductase
MPALPATKGLKFRIQVSSMNCVGCGLCASECLGNKAQLAKDPKTKNLALKMVEAKSQFAQQDGADYLYKHDHL